MATRKTTDQAAEEYPTLSDAEPAQAEEAEAEAKAPTKGKAAAAGPVFNPRRQFSMVWHDGLKAYLQDGVIFDRGSKKPVGKL